MSTRAEATAFTAEVTAVEPLTEHLVRLVLGGPGLRGFDSTGVPDEWVALTVPGQHQTRYYTVRSWDGERLLLDVVLHDQGLVTEWVQGGCVGGQVAVSPPRGSFALPSDARWLCLVGDLTALPAVARALETVSAVRPDLAVEAHVEAPDGPVAQYVAPAADGERVHWHCVPTGGSRLAALVEGLDWPEGPGYFWMAGESAQMRAIRKHLRQERGMQTSHYDVMGYWRAASPGRRGPRAGSVDVARIYREGRAAGKSDDEIWAEYDEAVRRSDC